MLYITTRDDKDAYTAPRTWKSDRAPDGGMFVPFKIPSLEQDEINALKGKTFGQTVAEIINIFFSVRLTAWDVDFCIGKNPVKTVSMNHRLIVAECWHNTDASYGYVVDMLYSKICGNDERCDKSTEWPRIAVRIAVLFGIYGELIRLGSADSEHSVDIAVPAEDFETPMAAWYARQMGLPVGTIICSCMESSAIWDVIRRGEVSTAGNALPNGLERLIHGTLGCEEVHRYLAASDRGGVYSVSGELLSEINNGVFAAVVGKTRINSIIKSMHTTNSYIIDPQTALAYGGLQDYRASTGESRPALLLADKNPRHSSDLIAGAIGISAEELEIV